MRAADGHLSSWIRFRDLVTVLTWRDLRVKYSQSVAGFGWAIAVPLCTVLVFSFVFRVSQFDVRSKLGMPYVLYALSGILPWSFFSGSLNGCINSLVANRSLVTKVYFPREALPFSAVLTAFIDFCISLIILLGLSVYLHISGHFALHITAYTFFLPAVVAVLYIYALGIGMLLATANLFQRDVRQAYTIGIQLWMFASGIVLPIPGDTELAHRLFYLNPLAAVIAAFRDCAILGVSPWHPEFISAACVAVFCFTFAWILFRRTSHQFAEII